MPTCERLAYGGALLRCKTAQMVALLTVFSERKVIHLPSATLMPRFYEDEITVVPAELSAKEADVEK
jgi:hypothetical protein